MDGQLASDTFPREVSDGRIGEITRFDPDLISSEQLISQDLEPGDVVRDGEVVGFLAVLLDHADVQVGRLGLDAPQRVM